MFREFREVFADDYIYIGRRRIRPFSFLWWAVRVGQGLLGVGMFYMFYVLLWLVCGP